jgi:hypothetical protein
VNNEQNGVEQMAGVKKPAKFILSAESSVYDDEHKIVREDVHQNGIVYVFPEGFNRLDLMEECRALQNTDDFDLMFDVTMQMLTGKPVQIFIRNRKNELVKQCEFQVTDQYQNLRGIDFIDTYPTVILWLTELIGSHLLKKYPTLGNGNKGTTKASKPPVPQNKQETKEKTQPTPFRLGSR